MLQQRKCALPNQKRVRRQAREYFYANNLVIPTLLYYRSTASYRVRAVSREI